MGELTGKTALVTGGSRGIGCAIAVALAEAGCDVAVNYLNSREKANEVVRQIAALGRRAIASQADVSQSEEVCSIGAGRYIGQ